MTLMSGIKLSHYQLRRIAINAMVEANEDARQQRDTAPARDIREQWARRVEENERVIALMEKELELSIRDSLEKDKNARTPDAITVLEEIFPNAISGDFDHLPDSDPVSLDIDFGKMRKARAAIEGYRK